MRPLKNKMYSSRPYFYWPTNREYDSPIYLYIEDLVEEGYYAPAMLADTLFPIKDRT